MEDRKAPSNLQALPGRRALFRKRGAGYKRCMDTRSAGTVLITGASAGIGRACAEYFARGGWQIALGARRVERIEADAPKLEALGAAAVHTGKLDVCDAASVEDFVASVLSEQGAISCLVNNAGKALGTERLDDAEGSYWREMIETNVVGVLQMTRQVLPGMIERKNGHVIMIGSVAGHHGYAGGSVYCATKRSLWSLCEALRRENMGKGIRVTSVDPGLVDTEFSPVRFAGDLEKAKKVYEGLAPLTASDVADAVFYAATRPPHVNLDRIQIMPTAQADPWHIHRETQGTK